MPATEPSETKRTDARRNRDAILAAALAALTDSPDASLNAIAKRAGVANATLYRHFPTREELVLATYEREVGRLVDAADVLLRDKPPPEALRTWVQRLAAYAVTKHGLADALRKATTPGNDLSSTSTYDAIVGALDRLLQANVSAGVLRPDLDADDVILAFEASGSSTQRATGARRPSASTTSSPAAYEPRTDMRRQRRRPTPILAPRWRSDSGAGCARSRRRWHSRSTAAGHFPGACVSSHLVPARSSSSPTRIRACPAAGHLAGCQRAWPSRPPAESCSAVDRAPRSPRPAPLAPRLPARGFESRCTGAVGNSRRPWPRTHSATRWC